MTDEQINRAIAEVCGWKPDKRGFGWINPHGYYAPEPDYCTDLNAIHKAEKVLNKDEFMLYCNSLWPLGHGVWEAIHATARQRAEAFLRTLGKWEEVQG